MTAGETSRSRARWLFLGVLLTYAVSFLLLTQVMNLPGVPWAPGVRVELREDGPRLSINQRAPLRTPVPRLVRGDLLLAGNLALMCAAYLGLLQLLCRRELRPPEQGLVAGAVLVGSGAMLLLPYLLSNDVYSYILQGRIAQLWDGNPVIEPPLVYAQDKTFAWTDRRWGGVPAVYGPVWLYISMGVTWLVEGFRGEIVSYVLAYKTLGLAFHLASAWLIWRILGMVAPQRRVWGTFMYAGSPLALIELVGSGHNDAALVFFLLAGILLHLCRRQPLALVAFFCAMLVKWTGGAAVLLYLVLLLRTAADGRVRLRVALWSTAIIVLAVGLGMLRFFGPQTLATLGQAPSQTRLTNSLAGMVGERFYGAPIDGMEGVVTIDGAYRRTAAKVGNVITAGAALVAVMLVSSGATALAGCAWLLFVYCTLGTGWFWPWYVTWFLALAALLDWRVTGRLAVLFSCTALLVYPFKFVTGRSLLVIAPVLLVAALLAWRARRAFSSSPESSPPAP
jgi:hypothetical protein